MSNIAGMRIPTPEQPDNDDQPQPSSFQWDNLIFVKCEGLSYMWPDAPISQFFSEDPKENFVMVRYHPLANKLPPSVRQFDYLPALWPLRPVAVRFSDGPASLRFAGLWVVDVRKEFYRHFSLLASSLRDKGFVYERNSFSVFLQEQNSESSSTMSTSSCLIEANLQLREIRSWQDLFGKECSGSMFSPIPILVMQSIPLAPNQCASVGDPRQHNLWVRCDQSLVSLTLKNPVLPEFWTGLGLSGAGWELSSIPEGKSTVWPEVCIKGFTDQTHELVYCQHDIQQKKRNKNKTKLEGCAESAAGDGDGNLPTPPEAEAHEIAPVSEEKKEAIVPLVRSLPEGTGGNPNLTLRDMCHIAALAQGEVFVQEELILVEWVSNRERGVEIGRQGGWSWLREEVEKLRTVFPEHPPPGVSTWDLFFRDHVRGWDKVGKKLISIEKGREGARYVTKMQCLHSNLWLSLNELFQILSLLDGLKSRRNQYTIGNEETWSGEDSVNHFTVLGGSFADIAKAEREWLIRKLLIDGEKPENGRIGRPEWYGKDVADLSAESSDDLANLNAMLQNLNSSLDEKSDFLFKSLLQQPQNPSASVTTNPSQSQPNGSVTGAKPKTEKKRFDRFYSTASAVQRCRHLALSTV